MDGSTQLDIAPTIEVGQQVGLATAADSSGVDRAIFIDIRSVEDTDTGSKPAKSIDLPGPSLPPGPTEKARGTVIATDATSVTVTIADTWGRTEPSPSTSPAQRSTPATRHATRVLWQSVRCSASPITSTARARS